MGEFFICPQMERVSMGEESTNKAYLKSSVEKIFAAIDEVGIAKNPRDAALAVVSLVSDLMNNYIMLCDDLEIRQMFERIKSLAIIVRSVL